MPSIDLITAKEAVTVSTEAKNLRAIAAILKVEKLGVAEFELVEPLQKVFKRLEKPRVVLVNPRSVFQLQA